MSSLIRVSDAATLGLHAMAYLARQGMGRVPARQIAEGTRVSGAHLAKVLGRLERAGLVRGTRGPRGGYALAKPASRVSLKDVYEAVEGPLCTTRCLFGRPSRCGSCLMGGLLGEIDGLVSRRLAGTRLSDVGVDVREWSRR
jgi:Rrf2 family protein